MRRGKEKELLRSFLRRGRENEGRRRKGGLLRRRKGKGRGKAKETERKEVSLVFPKERFEEGNKKEFSKSVL